jgi:hypothetical protein
LRRRFLDILVWRFLDARKPRELFTSARDFGEAFPIGSFARLVFPSTLFRLDLKLGFGRQDSRAGLGGGLLGRDAGVGVHSVFVFIAGQQVNHDASTIRTESFRFSTVHLALWPIARMEAWFQRVQFCFSWPGFVSHRRALARLGLCHPDDRASAGIGYRAPGAALLARSRLRK